jgi:hypothetical protein
MQAINWTSPLPKASPIVVWKTEPCPSSKSEGGHGPLELKPDEEDDEGLHHYVTCLSCYRTASAGVDPTTGQIDLFYEWGRSDPNTGDNFIWEDNDAGTEHPHTKQPVLQTSGPFKGQLWWVP